MKALSKPKKILLIVLIIAILVVGIIAALNARIKTPTEDDIVDAVILSYSADIEEVKEILELSDLTLVLEFDDLDIKKPTVFKEGRIFADVYDYFMCSDLDNIEYNKETYDKYSQLLYSYLRDAHAPWEFSYNDTEIDGYESVYVSRVPGHFTLLMDTQGNIYNFHTDLFTNTIEKNGIVVFSYDTGYTGPDLYSDDDSAYGDVCKHCGESVDVLTANGYCRTCIDTYYTDYYIGLDGEVYPDRPY